MFPISGRACVPVVKEWKKKGGTLMRKTRRFFLARAEEEGKGNDPVASRCSRIRNTNGKDDRKECDYKGPGIRWLRWLDASKKAG